MNFWELLLHKDIFELGMLIGFGVSWPLSIYKSYISKKTAGKSVLFLFFVFAGYLSGITNKIIKQDDFVIYFYILNTLMVAADILLYYRNKGIESKAYN